MSGLGIHAVVYVAVNALLVAVWILAGGSADKVPTYMTNLSAARDAGFWPVYVMIFWGVGLVIHAGVVVMTLPARIRQERARRRQRQNVQQAVVGILNGTVLEGAALAAIRATDGEKAVKKVRAEVTKARRDAEQHRAETAPAPTTADTAGGGGDATDGVGAEPARRRRGTRRPTAPSRQWMAVMFTDIVDSTPLAEALGDEAWAELLVGHRALVRRCVADHGGTEVGTQGDGFLIRFDQPDDAVRCASALQRELAERRSHDDAIPRLRIGLHAGEVVHDGHDDDLVGRVVNLASRVTGVAEADEILVTEPLADHLTVDVALTDRGLRQLKGIDRPRHLLAVVWRNAPEVVDLAGEQHPATD